MNNLDKVNDMELYTIKFDEPIEFTIMVIEIQTVRTDIGSQIWIEGKGQFGDKELRTGFYCPKELEFMLRDIELDENETVTIRYLGKRRYTKNQKEFHVKRIKLQTEMK